MTDPYSTRTSRRDAMREERLEILRLLEAGDISADEAVTLLEALDRAAQPAATADEAGAPGGRGRQVRIRVSDTTTGRASVNLAFPVGLIEAGLGIARRFAPQYLPDADAIRQSITSGFRGSIVDVDDGDERVEIIVE